jgi:hypothetical protein
MYATLEKAGSGGGAAEQYRLSQIGGPGTLLLRLWAEEPGDGGYLVEGDKALAEAGATPTVASVVTFAGPVSEAVRKAGDRAGRERIAPAMEGHPGAVRMLSLWEPRDRRHVIVVLATSVESLEEGGRQVSQLPLLPGEDVALLPGPDHVELFRVES